MATAAVAETGMHSPSSLQAVKNAEGVRTKQLLQRQVDINNTTALDTLGMLRPVTPTVTDNRDASVTGIYTFAVKELNATGALDKPTIQPNGDECYGGSEGYCYDPKAQKEAQEKILRGAGMRFDLLAN